MKWIKSILELRRNKIRLEFIKSFDTEHGSVLLQHLLQKEDPEKLRWMLMELVFPKDFEEPINEKKMFVIGRRLNKDENFHLFIKSRSTRSYRAFILAKSNEQDMLRGRIMEAESIISTCEMAETVLGNWKAYQAAKDKRELLKKFIATSKEKMLNVKK